MCDDEQGWISKLQQTNVLSVRIAELNETLLQEESKLQLWLTKKLSQFLVCQLR